MEYWRLFPEKEANQTIQFDWPELNDEGVLYHEKVKVARKKDIKYI